MSNYTDIKIENGIVYKNTYYWFLGFKRRRREILCELTAPNRTAWDKDAYKEYQELKLLVEDFYKRVA